MRTSLRRDLTAALKARDRVAVAALRSALSAIENAEAVPVDHAMRAGVEDERVAGSALGVGAAEAERRDLTDAEVRAIIDGEVHERVVAAKDYEAVGRHDVAERIRAEADVLGQYLR